jgi:gamma-glutamyltranspeptidase/glutathione hydrolase/leukotriene-C4 hydrolase
LNLLNSPKVQAERKTLTSGPLAAAVPGEIRGLFEAKKRYGNPGVSWASLLRPTIDMCRSGLTISRSLADALAEKTPEIFADPGLR